MSLMNMGWASVAQVPSQRGLTFPNSIEETVDHQERPAACYPQLSSTLKVEARLPVSLQNLLKASVLFSSDIQLGPGFLCRTVVLKCPDAQSL